MRLLKSLLVFKALANQNIATESSGDAFPYADVIIGRAGSQEWNKATM